MPRSAASASAPPNAKHSSSGCAVTHINLLAHSASSSMSSVLKQQLRPRLLFDRGIRIDRADRSK